MGSAIQMMKTDRHMFFAQALVVDDQNIPGGNGDRS
jgi:hypothetical protein